MANNDHLARLQKGRRIWNQWRLDNPKIVPDLTKARLYRATLSNFDLHDALIANANLDASFLKYANLIGAQLGGASLKNADCRGADCRGTSLRGAELEGAQLMRANLRAAKLDSARLFKANLEECDLERADMRNAKLTCSVLRKADLGRADLSGARLDRADLSLANFSQATLRQANLRGAMARGTNFSLAILHLSIFEGADITGARLWESQRAGWLIKGIACESVFWDQNANTESRFAIGEFERLYGPQLIIELFYEGGITSFELNTLPALLHELSKLHPVCHLKLAAITEASGGALLKIRAEGIEEHELSSLQAAAEKMRDLQIQLRASDHQIERLQIEKGLLLDEVFPRLGARSINTVNIGAPSTHLAIGLGGSSVQLTHGEGPDSEALLSLLGDIKSQVTGLEPRRSLAIEIAEAMGTAQDALAEKDATPSYLARALTCVRDAVVKALTSEAASKLGDSLPMLIQKLEHAIKALT